MFNFLFINFCHSYNIGCKSFMLYVANHFPVNHLSLTYDGIWLPHRSLENLCTQVYKPFSRWFPTLLFILKMTWYTSKLQKY